MIAAINKNIEIPNVTDQSIDWDDLSDAGRTALGTYRKDSSGMKRTWHLRANKITKAQYDAVVDYLVSINQGETWFWLDELGGTAADDSVKAYVEIEQDDRTPFGSGGSWNSSGRVLNLRVIEK